MADDSAAQHPAQQPKGNMLGSGGRRRRAGGRRPCARAAGGAHAASVQQAAAVDAMEQVADAHAHTLLAAHTAMHAAAEAPAAARAVVAAPVAVWLMAFKDVVEAKAAMHTAISHRQRRGQWSLRRWQCDLQRCSGSVTRCAGGRAGSEGGSRYVGIGGVSGSGGTYHIRVLVKPSGVQRCAALHLGASRGSNACLSMRSVGRNLRKTAQVNIQLDSEEGQAAERRAGQRESGGQPKSSQLGRQG